MNPWHNCPECPACGLHAGLPIREAFNGHSGDSDSNLFCPACGHGWTGDDADVQRAEVAQAAWEASSER